MHRPTMNIALTLMAAFTPLRNTPASRAEVAADNVLASMKKGTKGQLRTTTGRSNAAAFKRAAKKRNNVRKHK